MKRTLSIVSVLVLALVLAVPVFADNHGPNVRVVHASPDAPAVDVLVNGAAAFTNAPFKGVTDYAGLTAGTYNVQVVPTGATEPVVIEADLDLQADTDYTVLAVNTLENIEPLVLVDNNSLPAAGKAHVRFVHASPDAPAVDIAVADGGPVLFSGVEFKGVGDYLPVDAGTYDLEARVAGTDTVALSLPGITLNDGTVYTVYAVGFAGGGDPALSAAISVDAQMATMLPATGNNSLAIFAGLILAGLGMVALGMRTRRAEVVA
jgi:LPXTG-motif cell wall-anchored protein